MKGIICYYSGSGNTKLACNYIKNKIKNADFDLYNIVKSDVPDFSKYDFAGFASFTDFGAPPKLLYSFIDKIDNQNGKNAFVFNTYGFMSGGTLKSMEQLLNSKGYNVLSGFTLHTPESYPPMRKRNKAFDDSPNTTELQRFDDFIQLLDKQINDLKSDVEIQNVKIKSPFSSLFLKFSREKAKKDFGIQNVDEQKCEECGVCMKGCPYEAITMNPKPIFNHHICAGCWYCYNHCKQKAIYTPKFTGKHQYPKPSEALNNKLNLK